MFPHFDLADLSQLPVLILHFQAHKVKSPQITFLEFLQAHYDEGSKHLSQDISNHQRLPFSKRHHQSGLFSMINDTAEGIRDGAGYQLLMTIGNVSYAGIPSRLQVKSIWQPPRV
jgi:hypothetical protein